MSHDILSQRCAALVGALNGERGWGLSIDTQRRYANQLAQLCDPAMSYSDDRLLVMAENYHADHEVVESLRMPERTQHELYWADWMQSSVRILLKELARAGRYGETSFSMDDLVQEAAFDLWIGLPKFRYESRFRTWAYSVVSHCLHRHLRSLGALKRRGTQQAVSLDEMLALGDTLYDNTTPMLDHVATNVALRLLIDQVLTEQPDQRLAQIFWMWAYEEQTLRAIGERLDLSAPRVHALLSKALTLLRNNSSLDVWLTADAPP